MSCPNLEHLALGGSNMNGAKTPESIDQLEHLETLDLHYANLSGTIPGALASLSNLTRLDLSGNGELSGALPASLGSCRIVLLIRPDSN